MAAKAAAAKSTVEIFYDVISPYAYIGFEVLCRCQQKWDIDVRFSPIYQLGLLNVTGTLGKGTLPGENPSKVAYLRKDVMRLSRHYSIDFDPEYMRTFEPRKNPLFLSQGTLAAQRMLVAVSMERSDLVKPLSAGLFHEHWGKANLNLKHPEELSKVALSVGLSEEEAQKLIMQTSDPAVKNELNERTQRLSDLGGFGVPTFIVHGKDGESHMLFGSDRFHIMADMLGSNGGAWQQQPIIGC